MATATPYQLWVPSCMLYYNGHFSSSLKAGGALVFSHDRDGLIFLFKPGGRTKQDILA